MEEQFICPLCNSNTGCKKNLDGENGYQLFHCEFYDTDFNISDDIFNIREAEEKDRILNLIVEYILREPYCMKNGKKYKWFFYMKKEDSGDTNLKNEEVQQEVNMFHKLENYPDNTSEFAKRALMNLTYKFPNYGDIITPTYQLSRLIFEHQIENIKDSGIMNLLLDIGYVKKGEEKHDYIITAEGWKKVDSIRNSEKEIRQGFIAMSFEEKTKDIREAFRSAIVESGYNVRIIDEKEHNNQIVSEIFYEIERSKFVVVDVTYPNYGAYYEAGYGQALKKEVIVCCRKEEFDKKETSPHFDIAQKSMIVWTDEDDLIKRLRKRIEATVR